jgi:hypothetical protein
MATVFYPSVLANDVFGSAGDVTAVHRDGKVYLRKRKVGAGVLSPAQLEHLEVHRRALAAWRGLDHVTQLVWNEYAQEVEPHRPPFDHSSWISGQNLFVSAYHGFHTLGNEHVPSPTPFESFPSFVVEAMSASLVGDDLLLRVSVVGLELISASRYWLYGRVQLTEMGKGASSRVARKSVLSSCSCESSPVELVLLDWRSVWPELVEKEIFQVHGSFVLLDAVTGYRSQRRRWSFKVSL